MREAIYESHGIMTSADKHTYLQQAQHNNSISPGNRKMHRFASGGIRHHSVTEKIAFPNDAIAEA